MALAAAQRSCRAQGQLLVQVVRRIEVSVREVKWAEAGELVAIISDASFYVLRFDRDAVEASQGQTLPEDGLEEAFDLLHEVPETVRTGETVRAGDQAQQPRPYAASLQGWEHQSGHGWLRLS